MVAHIKGIWPKFSTELSAAIYGADLEQMEVEFGKETVEKAIGHLKRTHDSDPPSIAEIWESCRDTRNGTVKATPLYDPNCTICEEGWESVGWSWFDSNQRNKLIKVYGFEEAQNKSAKIRCRVCWKGPKG